MCELVSLGRIRVRYHIQELWRNGTIKDEVPVEQLHFLDGLVSLQGCRGGSWCRRYPSSIVVFEFSSVRICIVRFLPMKNWSVVFIMIIVALILAGREIRKRMLLMWRRLVWLLVVRIVMSFGINRII